jgi:hypothetical protein
MEVLKKGDINKAGWEVVEVYMRPEYKIRKRIKINDDFIGNEEYSGKKGWLYFHLGYSWVELDDYPDKQLKIRESEIEYL